MRSQITLGLFLSICLPSMGHVAKFPPNSLQLREEVEDLGWDKFGDHCSKDSFDNKKCELTSHCGPTKSKLNINHCLSVWVPEGQEKNETARKSVEWKRYDSIHDKGYVKLKGANVCTAKGLGNCRIEAEGPMWTLFCDGMMMLPLNWQVYRNSKGQLVC
ncbi:hypothetical protein QBC45DRAFT_425140 [Copromyces sp. CBS 386.78]|nr:hypothetical protein QBC45DRAFT_425140 [Copromyces sp. CBS 386.78]